MSFITPLRIRSRASSSLFFHKGCVNYLPYRQFVLMSLPINFKAAAKFLPSEICFKFRYSSNSKSGEVEKNESQKLETVIDCPPEVKISQRTKLKQAIRDYGATIVVFHVAISLTSLGLCYLGISNGVDAIHLLTFLGFSESIISSKVAVGGSTFVISYAVHKLFAPVRIGITLSVAPFIVRYLRKINWIKPPKTKV